MKKSDEQALVERVRKMMARDPARADRMRVQWNLACELLAAYFVRDKLKSYEAHMLTNRARIAMLEAIEKKVPDKHLWIYAMFAARRPAAPHPKARKLCPKSITSGST